jgi:serine/threonine protein kinase
MPARWVRRSPQEFAEKYPKNSEQPWLDFATIALLNKREAPFACKLFGVFFDAETCYAVQSLANMGDFFSYCEKLPAPGPAREARLKPILDQTFSAVRQLHNLGVGHRDLSLENFVLHDEGGHVQVKMIDYGMATLKRFCMAEVRGKLSYQAPEMHNEDAAYDVFLTDAFAVGVIVYAFSVYDYPWTATKPSSCKFWSFFAKNGFSKMVEKRTLRSKFQCKRLVEVMSRELIDLIGGLVSVDPGSRLCLGEACFQGRASVSTCAWMSREPEKSQRASSKDYWSGRFFSEREESLRKTSKDLLSGRLFSFSSKR